jgi:hypothetical protein
MSKVIDLRARATRFGFAMGFAALTLTASAQAATVVNDSWADAGRTDGSDPQDTNWWASTTGTSTTSSAIEVSPGSLGLVTGSSGRGIHGTFTPQSLAVGDRLTVTFTFTTPDPVGTNVSTGFKVGLFNASGNPALAADLTASSTSPNALYDALTGYMLDYDVNTATANINFREKDSPGTTGQLLGTTTGYTNLSGGGIVYAFAADTTYTGVYAITRTASGIDLTGSLSNASGLLSTFTTSDASPTATTFDMLAFHANSSAFGTANTVGAADNGIDFSNITIDVSPVPEPGAALTGLGFACFALRRGRRA